MRSFALSGLIAAQLLTAAQPALATNFTDTGAHEAGVFAGVRLRVPLDGGPRAQPLRAGLALAQTVQSRSLNGSEVRTRIGEGVELGLRGRDASLSIAGTPVSQLVQGGRAGKGERAGVSTIGWVAIGVGALVTIVLVAGAICLSDNDCIPSE